MTGTYTITDGRQVDHEVDLDRLMRIERGSRASADGTAMTFALNFYYEGNGAFCDWDAADMHCEWEFPAGDDSSPVDAMFGDRGTRMLDRHTNAINARLADLSSSGET